MKRSLRVIVWEGPFLCVMTIPGGLKAILPFVMALVDNSKHLMIY
jgi:hypothetical protein